MFVNHEPLFLAALSSRPDQGEPAVQLLSVQVEVEFALGDRLRRVV